MESLSRRDQLEQWRQKKLQEMDSIKQQLKTMKHVKNVSETMQGKENQAPLVQKNDSQARKDVRAKLAEWKKQKPKPQATGIQDDATGATDRAVLQELSAAVINQQQTVVEPAAVQGPAESEVSVACDTSPAPTSMVLEEEACQVAPTASMVDSAHQQAMQTVEESVEEAVHNTAPVEEPSESLLVMPPAAEEVVEEVAVEVTKSIATEVPVEVNDTPQRHVEPTLEETMAKLAVAVQETNMAVIGELLAVCVAAGFECTKYSQWWLSQALINEQQEGEQSFPEVLKLFEAALAADAKPVHLLEEQFQSLLSRMKAKIALSEDSLDSLLDSPEPSLSSQGPDNQDSIDSTDEPTNTSLVEQSYAEIGQRLFKLLEQVPAVASADVVESVDIFDEEEDIFVNDASVPIAASSSSSSSSSCASFASSSSTSTSSLSVFSKRTPLKSPARRVLKSSASKMDKDRQLNESITEEDQQSQGHAHTHTTHAKSSMDMNAIIESSVFELGTIKVSKQKAELFGSKTVVTPIRRSTRHRSQSAMKFEGNQVKVAVRCMSEKKASSSSSKEVIVVDDLLESASYAYTPNKFIPTHVAHVSKSAELTDATVAKLSDMFFSPRKTLNFVKNESTLEPLPEVEENEAEIACSNVDLSSRIMGDEVVSKEEKTQSDETSKVDSKVESATGSVVELTVVRATKRIADELGSDMILTPLRRSTRRRTMSATKAAGSQQDVICIDDLLSEANYTYVPNPAILEEGSLSVSKKRTAPTTPVSTSKCRSAKRCKQEVETVQEEETQQTDAQLEAPVLAPTETFTPRRSARVAKTPQH
eukprot:GILK01004419.1.p1 GENE.GILK01004419.1~~GILK01004419.1.p1  ORF type:complete len:834 (+),score=216.50 GILK01004419.1:47-2503(+)